jgi:hypothetical protein
MELKFKKNLMEFNGLKGQTKTQNHKEPLSE